MRVASTHIGVGGRVSVSFAAIPCDAKATAQVLKTSTVGNTFSNLGRQLLDGHWVLSFIDADRCAAARDLIDAGQVHSAAPPPQEPTRQRMHLKM